MRASRLSACGGFRAKNTKTDVTKHHEVFNHVGLLGNEPPGAAGLLFI
jgi:hypothetical protein